MNGIGTGVNSLGQSRASIHDRHDDAADTDIHRAQDFTPTSDKNAWLSKPFRVDASAQRRSPRPRSAPDPGYLPENVSTTHVLAHSNEQNQHRSKGAGVVFAPAPP